MFYFNFGFLIMGIKLCSLFYFVYLFYFLMYEYIYDFKLIVEILWDSLLLIFNEKV